MVSIKNISALSDDNRIYGTVPNLKNSEINFKGKNNILYCEPGVTLVETILNFNGDNSVIYLGANRWEYKLYVSAHADTVFHMGTNNFINQKMAVFLSEQRHCYIGDYGIFSWGITLRNSDSHIIYDCSTKKRINYTQSVFIGDHVWIGHDSSILKGTQIDSGSIVGSNSVIAGKKIPHNTIWGGSGKTNKRRCILGSCLCRFF